MSDPLSTILIILFIFVPFLIILINHLERTRKRYDEMRDLQKEANRLLTEIASFLKNNH